MFTLFAIVFLLVFGSLNTLTTKWQFTMVSVGLDGAEKNFQKPWWGNFAMFVAMIAVLPVYWVGKYMDKPKADKEEPLLKDEEKEEKPKSTAWSDFVAVLLPAALDLISSGLNFIGLLYISASVWQMLRGSMIIFSALLSILFLGRKMEKFHWLGIGLCFAGIACVGAASVLGAPASDDADDPEAGNSGNALMGVMFVMIAQMIQAGQIVAEERLLKNLSLPGTLVVAYEGTWGALLMVAIVFPLMQVLPGSDVGGVQENTLDTLIMIDNSYSLKVLLCVYLLSCSTYNIARMLVTSLLSAVHFTMIDASRTCLIWTLDLGIMYMGPPSIKAFGETWTPYSPLQALGFLCLIMGQCVYGGLLRLDGLLPGLYPKQADGEIEEWQHSLASLASPASRHLGTPLPPFSPQQAVQEKQEGRV